MATLKELIEKQRKTVEEKIKELKKKHKNENKS